MKFKSTKARWAAAGAGVLAVATLGAQAGLAVEQVGLSGSGFEIDKNANLKFDGDRQFDWNTVDDTSKIDKASGTGDDSFGQGTKEDTAVPTVVSGSIPPNKSDLKRFGVYQEGTSSDGFLHLYWTRVQDPNGTTNMDFEFNQSKTLSSNGVTPVRTIGDLLITYDLANGGTNPILGSRTWTGSSWGNYTPFNGSVAAGAVNTTAIPANESEVGALSARTFGEASIRLSAILPTGVCTTFGSAYLKSRSSDSFTAALKDFIAPQGINITNCGSVNIVKTDDAGNALDGAEFTLYKDNAPVGGTRGAEDTITTLKCTTIAAGTCSITSVPFGSYWVVETVTPSGYGTAADQSTSISAATPTVTLNFENPRPATSMTTAQTWVPRDSATISAPSGGDLAGSVSFALYNTSNCTGTAIDSATVAVAGASPRTVSSGAFPAQSTSGNYSWLVSYDSTNSAQRDIPASCHETSVLTITNGGTVSNPPTNP